MKTLVLRSTALIAVLSTGGCVTKQTLPPRIPAVEYSRRLQDTTRTQVSSYAAGAMAGATNSRSDQLAGRNVGFISDNTPRARFAGQESVTNESATPKDYVEYRSQKPNERDYNGPLSLGDPGLTASLWRESNGNTEMFRDLRAFAPMDLITIVVTEKTKASGKADTETKESADVSASIPNLLGLEKSIAISNPNINLAALITAAATNNFKGEGTTNREGDLTAKISGVVVEVLPGGLLRIEGEKIIAVNSEEQNLVITGLVRTRDISSNNEVNSSKIANLRIDYFGKGIIGEAQDGGWLSRIMRRVWPF